MIARRVSTLQAAAPLTLTLALVAGSLAQPAMARSKVKPEAVETALSKGDPEKGVALAEISVAQAPREASLRATLGRAYLKNGRFQSAATALSDAVTLGDNSGRTLLALALAQIGSGQNEAALHTLDMGNNVIPVADLGLALALAGEGDKGSLMLGDAVRAGDRSDKLRANLGYAYALAGRWAEARTIVAMDLPADKVDERMTEWAQAARPEAGRERVAKLLGVGLADDAGMPMQLALNRSEGPMRMASAEATAVSAAPMPATPMPALAAAAPAPAPESALAEAPASEQVNEQAPAQTELPAVAEPVAQPAPAFTPAPFTPAPVFHAIPVPMTAQEARPVRAARPVAMAVAVALHNPRIKAAAKPKAAQQALAVETARAESRSASGSHVLQLGAFLSEKNALRAKKTFLSREKSFADADVVIAKATVDNRQFWRVSVNGFSANAASNKCAAIRKSGGACFAHSSALPAVTPNAKGATTTGAHATGQALAMATPKR